jgi:hypothetical protein
VESDVDLEIELEQSIQHESNSYLDYDDDFEQTEN